MVASCCACSCTNRFILMMSLVFTQLFPTNHHDEAADVDSQLSKYFCAFGYKNSFINHLSTVFDFLFDNDRYTGNSLVKIIMKFLRWLISSNSMTKCDYVTMHYYTVYTLVGNRLAVCITTSVHGDDSLHYHYPLFLRQYKSAVETVRHVTTTNYRPLCDRLSTSLLSTSFVNVTALRRWQTR